jgi:hypothetical protein
LTITGSGAASAILTISTTAATSSALYGSKFLTAMQDEDDTNK